MGLQRLAPQAYTKETLIKAFEWLQSQDESIKSIATSVDALIGLYMKAKLQGEESLHRLSIKNFKNDLKNLAHIVGDWEHSGASAHSPNSPTTASNYASYSPSSTSTQGVLQGNQENASTSATARHQPGANEVNASGASMSGTSVPGASVSGARVTDGSGVANCSLHRSRSLSQPHSSSFSACAGLTEGALLLPSELERDLMELTKALHLSHCDEALRMALRIGIEQMKRLIYKN